MPLDHLKFSPEILRRLGEELTPHPDQGVLELVRNSYDADAVNCTIAMDKTDRPGGTVTILDDGAGMDAEEITNGWLLIGKSAKLAKRRTQLGRLIVGNKGLGRLAALRMGSEVVLRTRPKAHPDQEFALTIDWSRYDAVTTVEQVQLAIESKKPSLPTPGTQVVIRKLTKAFGSEDVHRLARALVLLADPFEGATSYRPVLEAKEFQQLSELVKEKYFKDAEFHMIATLDEKGSVSTEVLLSNGRVKWSANHTDIAAEEDRYMCPPARFELWIFLLKSDSFTTKRSTLQEVRNWLSEYGGVHLYHRGLRVQPYGDPGHDWLDMNLARTRSPDNCDKVRYLQVCRHIVESLGF